MNTGPKNIIGPRVRRLRRVAGMTIEQLAKMVAAQGGDLCASDLRKIERRERRVKDHEVLRLANALGVDLETLFPKR